ncbi:MAG: CocE/NonD family hydrolase [Candidatus Sphingomonas colombiensis]|nr:CocE/NonD family hydrolase [Sphingomonas sp.]WEK43964.1 MAG: CocE/NonD family hydrolase [Sphingomonas sp.]
MKVRNLVLVALLGTASMGVAEPLKGPDWAKKGEPGLSDARYKVVIEKNVPVPMRDGVKLAADVYRPDAPGKFPVIVLRTPYNKASPDEIANSTWYAERGYVVVNEDVRGRFASGGDYYTYRHEARDGYDTDAWAATQPWSSGKLGTLGGSYLGYTGLTQAIGGHPALKAVATDVTTTDIYNHWVYSDGAFILGFSLPWGAGTVHDRTTDGGGAFTKPEAYAHLPLGTADSAAYKVDQPYRDWLEHPLRSDSYWNGISFEKDAAKIGIPTLVVSGWYDIFLRGALGDHAAIKNNGSTALARAQKRIVIGPWTHFKTVAPRKGGFGGMATADDVDYGADADLNGNLLYLRWHDHWLKGVDNGADKDPPVRIFVMGENKWRAENEWPLKRTRYTPYYLASGGNANTADGNGTLSTAKPTGADGDRYDYDPANPVPTLGGNICCSSVPSGAHDHRSVEKRADVLVFTGPVLDKTVEVSGPIRAKLYAASSAPDTDWVVRLIDVDPSGYARNIQDGIIRARYRKGWETPASPIEAGRVYEYDIDMWASSNAFLPGHRIRVEVTSSNFPRFDRNLNTGEDPATGTRMAVARQQVLHSARYPSHVLLPIIPR